MDFRFTPEQEASREKFASCLEENLHEGRDSDNYIDFKLKKEKGHYRRTNYYCQGERRAARHEKR